MPKKRTYQMRETETRKKIQRDENEEIEYSQVMLTNRKKTHFVYVSEWNDRTH